MRRDPFLLSDGLQEWIRGVDSHEAAAAGANLAHTLILAHEWLKAQFEKE